MFGVFQHLFIAGVALVTALLVFLGAAPEQAVAPTDTPPAPIAIVEEEPVEDTRPPAATKQEVPALDTTLQEALEALAKLEAEKAAAASLPPSALNDSVRQAVVNIICMTAGAGPLNPISASGVIVDPRGIILTNAHVAQYLLLKDYPVPGFIECTVRTGSPAMPRYRAELLFISPSWIADNAEKIDDDNPTGNGEHDYALLRITGGVSSAITPPALFPYLPLATESPKAGAGVIIVGYPAGFLGGITVAKELYAVSANATVGERYTFNASTVDLFSVGGTVLSQHGSSGGAVAEARSDSPSGAALVGLVVTATDAADTASRDLRALSTDYIIRNFLTERGIPLVDYLARNLAQEASLFNLGTAPTLTKQLTDVLER